MLKMLTAAFLFLLAATSAIGQTELVRFQDYPGPGNFLLKVAIANKYCEKYGIRCEAKPLPLAPQGMQAMLAGELEVASVPSDIAIQAASRGANIKTIGAFAVQPVAFLVGGKHVEWPGLNRGYPEVMKDLRGRKVGVPVRGSVSELYLEEMLKVAGMSVSDVSVIPVGGPNTAYPALVNKQVDAMIAIEPAGGFCKALNTCSMLVDPRKGQGPSSIQEQVGATSILVVKNEYLTAKPAVINAISSAFKDAEAYIQNPDNKLAVYKIASDNFKLDIPEGNKVIEAFMDAMIPSYKFSLQPRALQSYSDFLHRAGHLEKPFNTNALLMTR
jgi:NitT/TauT family transport system substrate-binding protein